MSLAYRLIKRLWWVWALLASWPHTYAQHDLLCGLGQRFAFAAPLHGGAGNFSVPTLAAATDQVFNEPISIDDQLPQSHVVAPASSPPVATVTDSQLDAARVPRSFLGEAAETTEFLDPDDAFQLDIIATNASTLAARFVIADGYYLYRDKTTFSTTTANASLNQYELPPGQEKEDKFLGQTLVYYSGFEVPLALKRENAAAGSVAIRAEYQGCADWGICYPPIVKTFDIALAATLPTAQAADEAGVEPSKGSAAGGNSQPLTAGALVAYLAAAFGAGLLLTFTPCVLPMIPILSGIIVGQGTQVSKTKGATLAIAYVLGTAATYTVIGVVAGATGDQLQAYFQNVWAIGMVSAVLVAMALSMFGLYDIQIPSSLQSRLQSRTQGVSGGSLGMVFVLGAVSALIVGPCVSPLLISALSVAIASADPVLGGAIMFFMALGMGIVFIALGFGAGFALPKAGPWMEHVKQALGVMLLGVAIYVLGILPQIPVLLLWAALLIPTAVYLGTSRTLPAGESGWWYLWRGAGTLTMIWGLLALVGGLAGNRELFNPLPQLTELGVSPVGTTSSSNDDRESQFVRVSSVKEVNEALAAARSAGRPVMLDFYADWCTDCKRMEKHTLRNPSVSAELARFVLVQVDVTDPRDAASRDVKQKYGVFGPPAMLFFDKEGRELDEHRFYGYRTVDEFLKIILAIH